MTEFAKLHEFKKELATFLPEEVKIRTKTVSFSDLVRDEAVVVTLLLDKIPTNVATSIAAFREKHGPSTVAGRRIIF